MIVLYHQTYFLQGELTNGQWEEKAENVNFADFHFTLTRHMLVSKARPEETTADADNAATSKEGKVDEEESGLL